MAFNPGERVRHPDFGEGIVVALAGENYVRVFFQSGERQIPLDALQPALERNAVIVANTRGDEQRARKAWLSWKAHALPLLEAASSLTSARIDLLPHQVVLTHRVATASPRRFLIADEVGLGKTIETALILRELASRGELDRALMVVPAGLVNNWHRELNEVFNLNFEVFGHQGDVSDRKTNAFAKHNRLIASIDTLKRPARIKKLLDAPRWDLVVFDEAHHLTAYRSGNKVRKTENYKLGEVLRDHARDLLLLSATPHQGDHFRFWKLVQLLEPALFRSHDEMVEHRHRLNTLIFRRTKADACNADGSTLFARRWVHTESFLMNPEEELFYQRLNEYLRDGFALAKQQGGKGRALGFVMTIFQKIAASSFAAVNRTLRRRLIALSVQEGLVHDSNLDIDQRDEAFNEARELIRTEFGLGDDKLAAIDIDHILNDLKRRQLKTMKEDELALAANEFSNELDTSAAEDAAMNTVALALPEERLRIKDLLTYFPEATETKVAKLIQALGVLWQQNPDERVVIFATYLGTVEMLGTKIEQSYPGQGVVVLKGGDHGSKTAAEKKFKQKEGPRVMICTAAGREGINLQHARILFNFDLPWNPMDVEQRIGRIHRYGQRDTAQVYNLVLSDTIEGKIFLLLDDKLTDIAKAVGKVDEHGNVAEDLRSQILGQLSEQVNYQSLYAQALDDPQLQRTSLELDAAMQNASEAQEVVFELFQDLDRFSLDDYSPLSDVEAGMNELMRFFNTGIEFEGNSLSRVAEHCYQVMDSETGKLLHFTDSRELANEDDALQLIGLDHSMVSRLIGEYAELPAEALGIAVQSPDGTKGCLSIWKVETTGERGQIKRNLVTLALDTEGARVSRWQHQPDLLFQQPPAISEGNGEELLTLAQESISRELNHRGIVKQGQTYTNQLVGWVEVV